MHLNASGKNECIAGRDQFPACATLASAIFTPRPMMIMMTMTIVMVMRMVVMMMLLFHIVSFHLPTNAVSQQRNNSSMHFSLPVIFQLQKIN